MKILKYNDFYKQNEFFEFFLSNLDNYIKESSDYSFVDKILKGLSNDLKFNIGLVFTFGTGIKAMFPIVENLIKNGNLKIDINQESIVLLSLTILSICYLEETKNNAGGSKSECQDCKSKGCNNCNNTGFVSSKVTKKDAQNLLEELKMRGIGNGIVKKFVKVFKTIGEFIKTIFKNTGYAISGLFEMLGYTALLMPFMNAINAAIGKYDLSPDTLVGNLLSIGLSVGAFSGKNVINMILKKLKDKLNLKISSDDLDTPISVKSYDIIDSREDIDKDKSPINEQ
jgi:hypothetical protein